MAKLFITTYALYNEGRQFESKDTGFWFDVEEKTWQEICDHFEKIDPDPELMFTCYEDFPEKLYSESMSEKGFDEIKEYAELDDNKQEGYQFLRDHMGYEHDLAISKADDVHFQDQSPENYAYDYIDECYELTDWIKGHLDYESIAKELEMNNEIIQWNNRLVIGAEGI